MDFVSVGGPISSITLATAWMLLSRTINNEKTQKKRSPVGFFLKPEGFFIYSGAGEESRTLDLNLGKVALYQLSYSRRRRDYDRKISISPVPHAKFLSKQR
jgi:hypothetical protein